MNSQNLPSASLFLLPLIATFLNKEAKQNSFAFGIVTCSFRKVKELPLLPTVTSSQKGIIVHGI